MNKKRHNWICSTTDVWAVEYNILTQFVKTTIQFHPVQKLQYLAFPDLPFKYFRI